MNAFIKISLILSSLVILTSCMEQPEPPVTTDTVEHCGDDKVNCTTLNGWNDGVCRDGVCVPTTCDTGFQISNGVCVQHSTDNCNGMNCTLLEGWKEGRCEEGNCVITECRIENYYLNDGKCALNNNENCGSAGNKCETGKKCSQGVCDSSCKNAEAFCTNAEGISGCTELNTLEHCGACNNPCLEANIPNSETVDCQTGECRPLTCNPNYHLDNNTCIKNSAFRFKVKVDKAPTDVLLDPKKDFYGDHGYCNEKIEYFENDLSQLTIDCGDNGVVIEGKVGCTFNAVGTHSVEIYGSIAHLQMCDPKTHTITEVSEWGSSSWKSLSYMFNRCKDLQITATDIPDFSQVKQAAGMFSGSDNVSVQGNMWNRTTSICFCNLFGSAKNISDKIVEWDTSNVTNMAEMFQSTNVNLDISKWDTSNVTNMAAMFSGGKDFNQPIGAWNTSKVTNMTEMFFEHLHFNQNVSNWNVENLEIADCLFGNTLVSTIFNQPIDGWDLRHLTSGNFFYGSKYPCSQLTNIKLPAGKDLSWLGCIK